MENIKKVSGINGWLLFFSIGLLLGPIILIYRFMMEYKEIGLLSIFIYIILILTSLYTVYLLLKKKILFIKWILGYIVLSVLLNRFLFILNTSYTSDIVREMMYNFLISDILIIVIWILYFINSKRVKNTFIY